MPLSESWTELSIRNPNQSQVPSLKYQLMYGSGSVTIQTAKLCVSSAFIHSMIFPSVNCQLANQQASQVSQVAWICCVVGSLTVDNLVTCRSFLLSSNFWRCPPVQTHTWSFSSSSPVFRFSTCKRARYVVCDKFFTQNSNTLTCTGPYHLILSLITYHPKISQSFSSSGIRPYSDRLRLLISCWVELNFVLPFLWRLTTGLALLLKDSTPWTPCKSRIQARRASALDNRSSPRSGDVK